jgi:hypothetical protein
MAATYFDQSKLASTPESSFVSILNPLSGLTVAPGQTSTTTVNNGSAMEPDFQTVATYKYGQYYIPFGGIALFDDLSAFQDSVLSGTVPFAGSTEAEWRTYQAGLASKLGLDPSGRYAVAQFPSPYGSGTIHALYRMGPDLTTAAPLASYTYKPGSMWTTFWRPVAIATAVIVASGFAAGMLAPAAAPAAETDAVIGEGAFDSGAFEGLTQSAVDSVSTAAVDTGASTAVVDSAVSAAVPAATSSVLPSLTLPTITQLAQGAGLASSLIGFAKQIGLVHGPSSSSSADPSAPANYSSTAATLAGQRTRALLLIAAGAAALLLVFRKHEPL